MATNDRVGLLVVDTAQFYDWAVQSACSEVEFVDQSAGPQFTSLVKDPPAASTSIPLGLGEPYRCTPQGGGRFAPGYHCASFKAASGSITFKVKER